MDYLFLADWVCPRCEREYDKKPPVRCSTCGCYIEPEHLREYWDQDNPLYSDANLKNFAENATRHLLEVKYLKAGIPMYTINWVDIHPYTWRNWGKYTWEGDWGDRKGTIHYNIQTLRNKKQCGNSVAHESAHATPNNFFTWNIIKRKMLDKAKTVEELRTQEEKWRKWYKTGHHKVWQPIYWKYREEVKKAFPQYWGE